ncbi:arginase family protein, partial [Bacillus subtilis]
MNKQVSLIGMPMDLGQARRGVDMGPSAIRYAHIVERLNELGYDIDDLGDVPINRDQPKGDEGLKNLVSVLEGNRKLADIVDNVVEPRRFPLVLGGDHSIAIGTLAGVAKHYQQL